MTPEPNDEAPMPTGDAFIDKYSRKELISGPDDPSPWDLIQGVIRRRN
jgi:hypothetical protein